MLCELYIENIAVIEKTSIKFSSGFNVLTGETGAGKSMLIHSLNMLLGERVSRDIVRTGANKASVTAVFNNISMEAVELLKNMGHELSGNDDLIISRDISSDGRSICRIMGKPSTVSNLKSLSGILVNIHGQHDNQELLIPEKHINFIDAFAEVDGLLSKYSQLYSDLQLKKQQLNSFSTDEGEKARKIDMLTYQIEEIENANLSEEEEEGLTQELNTIQNAEKIVKCFDVAHKSMYGDENDIDSVGALNLIKMAISSVEEVQSYVEGSAELLNKFRDIYYEAEEISEELNSYIESTESDPYRVNYIQERLDEIYKIKRKYGGEIADVLSFLDTARDELENIELSDVKIRELENEIGKIHNILDDMASELSSKRIKASEKFVQAVCDELKFLDMANVNMSYLHQIVELNRTGKDHIQFLISTNPGEEPRPLAKIASGGELSRIMLSIKNVLAGKDDIDTLIFDEVDTGVSGRAAQKIGLKLRSASVGRQILCVTHLAQIAALADNHMLIKKQVIDSRTFTEVLPLDREGRKQELARIMGGEQITPLLLENAEEMLSLAGN